MSQTWHARQQQDDTGTHHMPNAQPLLDTTRARRQLDWEPRVDAVTVLREVLTGMRERASVSTPVLRPRTVAGAVRDALTRGPVGQRDRP